VVVGADDVLGWGEAVGDAMKELVEKILR